MMDLAELRQKIRAIEWRDHEKVEACATGISEVDSALPMGGLLLGRIHEIIAVDKGAALGFCASILSKLVKIRGSVLWCSTKEPLYPLGIKLFGLSPWDVIFAQTQDSKEQLWVLQEALKNPAISCVVVEELELRFSQVRALQIAAAKSGVTLLIVSSPEKRKDFSFETTRWQVSAMPTVVPFLMYFKLELRRCVGGYVPLCWNIGFDATLSSFQVARSSAENMTQQKAVG